MSIFVDIGRYMSKNVDFCVDICRYMSISAELVMPMSVDICRYMSKIVDIADGGGGTLRQDRVSTCSFDGSMPFKITNMAY